MRCIIELYEKWFTFANFFSYWDYSGGYRLLLSLVETVKLHAMGRAGGGGAQRSVLRINEPKKKGAL